MEGRLGELRRARKDQVNGSKLEQETEASLKGRQDK
jgi:hypothetical protein